MGVLGDNAFSPGDIMRRLRDLERLVRELIAGRRLESASIGKGGITVKGGGGVRVVDSEGRYLAILGDLSVIDPGLQGLWLGRAGGGPAFAVTGTGPSDPGFVGVYDRAGQYIVSDDTWSGRGLARPYIPLQVGEVAIPTATTTASDWTILAVGMMPVQHPVLYAYLLVRSSDASTTGEVRLVLDGNQVGEALPVAAGSYDYAAYGPAPLPTNYPFGALRPLLIEARRTSGTGTVGVRVLSVLGLESSYLPAE